MELVDEHQGFVIFPTVGTRIVAGPSYKELHAGSSVMITAMSYDISDHFRRLCADHFEVESLERQLIQ